MQFRKFKEHLEHELIANFGEYYWYYDKDKKESASFKSTRVSYIYFKFADIRTNIEYEHIQCNIYSIRVWQGKYDNPTYNKKYRDTLENLMKAVKIYLITRELNDIEKTLEGEL